MQRSVAAGFVQLPPVEMKGWYRCHTSAHQAELLRKGERSFLVTGDVYRRDSVDRTHYPVFHQMEGFRVFAPEEIEASGMSGALLSASACCGALFAV